MRISEKFVLMAFACATAFIALLAMSGGVRTYSPVPYWDMWDGYLDFYLKVAQGDWSTWWAQHNEHRILWSRVLFWLDIDWFGGTGVFLIVMNYVLAGTAGLIFCRLVAWSMPEASMRAYRWGLSLFLLGWVFLWSQSENFTWGFQSQFFLAQLLPLCALVALYRSAEPSASRSTFVCACLLGLASLGTMVNGVLTLPLMVLCGALLRIGARRIVVLLALTAAGLLLFFLHYSTNPVGGVSLSSALISHPIEICRNLVVYLGSPFFYLMRQSSHSVQIAAGAGTLLLGVSVWWGALIVKRGKQPGIRIALLTYLVFIGGTALATSIGRLGLGPDLILSSRYSTPAVMAWAAFLVLLGDDLKERLKTAHPLAWLLPLLALYFYIALVQFRNMPTRPTDDPRRNLASLALAVGARDDSRIGLIYPYIEHVLGIAARATQKDISIFGLPALQGVRTQLGQEAKFDSFGHCIARIDYVHHLEAGKYDRISGWVQGVGADAGQGLWLLDKDGKRAGYALISTQSHKMRSGTGADVRFDGYVAKSASDNLGAAQLSESGCVAKLTPLPILLSASPIQQSASNIEYVGVGAVVANDGWTGADYQRSTLAGFKVLGSYVQHDSDTGTLKVKVMPGESVLYRSGPIVRSQFLRVGNESAIRITLPEADNWVRLDFHGVAANESELEITFTDAGTGNGEWSAIALADK